MLKKIFLALFVLAVGMYIGFSLPRGASLISTVMNLGAHRANDYSQSASHQAFLEMEDMIASTREMVLTDARTQQEANEGMRWMLRALAMSTEVAADTNPRLPHFQRMDTLARKVGGDNPDAEYEFAQIDGRYDYRITGNLGNIRYLGFTINAGQGMTPRRQIGYISDEMLDVDENGNFTFLLSQEQPTEPGQWIQIPEDASGILVREYIGDREVETLPTLDIEIMGPAPPFTPPTDEEIAASIIGTTYAFLKLTTLHRYVLPRLLDEQNDFIRATSEELGGAISGADNLYMIGSYQIEDDEALIVKVQPPKSRYWNLTLENRWHEIGDYLHRPTSRTLEDVEYNEDGSVEFVISHRDPGHPNWLDTSGHGFGFMTFRWVDGEINEIDMPTTRIVGLDEIMSPHRG
ncbi:MAG: DUF1214 domain-containing protein [Myxococcota bacterium]